MAATATEESNPRNGQIYTQLIPRPVNRGSIEPKKNFQSARVIASSFVSSCVHKSLSCL